ncbi:hypothetical protein NDU88_002129 [Pleurodeles waltl]|uniref:Uncharacterized protein n=1 Tax=Pleurodeles waltl TaxID=8319 RepID=A0AAV7VZS5_PLEWA|nr:hypothetical protein NDU88_002129 [Pleurodeles waltl]
MPPGGFRSFAEPTGVAFWCTPVLVPDAAVLAAMCLGSSPTPRPRAGASAVSPFPGRARSALARALRLYPPNTHTGTRRSPGR